MFRFIFYMFNILVVIMFVKVFITQDSYEKNDKLNQKIELLENEYLSLLEKKNILRNNIESFNNNRNFQKSLIRKEIGFIDENDKLYIFN